MDLVANAAARGALSLNENCSEHTDSYKSVRKLVNNQALGHELSIVVILFCVYIL